MGDRRQAGLDPEPGVKYARCPKCRGRYLSIIETHEEIGWTDFALHEVSGTRVYPAGPFWFDPGDSIRVDMECSACGHLWRSRRKVG